MKKIIFVMCLLLSVCLTGCGNETGSCKDDTLDINKMMMDVNTKSNEGDWKAGVLQDTSLDAANLAMLYQINSVNLEEYTVRTALLETDATEIAVFHATSENMQEVKAGVAFRIEALKTKWRDVDKKQYNLVKQYVTYQCGNYYVMIIAKDADDIASFMKAF